MNLFTLIFLAAGLSMDAFAVAICKGLSMPKATNRNCFLVAIWFGSFQGLMPLIGYFFGIQFASYMEAFSSYIACFLLVLIGLNMIREAFQTNSCEQLEPANLGFRNMFVLALATSIDALAVGITFACVPVALFPALYASLNTAAGCLVIALITFIISFIGVKIGNIFGSKYQKKAEITGAILLILLGIKILVEHLYG